MSKRPRQAEPNDSPGSTENGWTFKFGSSRSHGPGVLDTLTDSFGPVPRVLLRDTDVDATSIIRPASAEVPSRPDTVGRYQFFGEIGRGGVGAVLKGRDPDLGRELAVKVLLEKHSNDAEMVCRFVEEAQIAGQLQHPGIVPIYELGAFSDRRPYFAMKLVKGRTLAALVAERPSERHELPRFLAIFEAIAQAVGYAHSRGVIHRDLKPSNVMVGSFGEVQVMDWGLAKVLSQGGASDDASAGVLGEPTMITTGRSASDSDLSLAGSIMGTPSYMAPEQAQGELGAVDERSDVFALGSILSEIMTGNPAFTGRTPDEIQRKAARGDLAVAFSRLDACGADHELVALAKACLSPDRDARPRDAGEIARSIGIYRAGVDERLRAAEISRSAEAARAEEALRTAQAAQAQVTAERKARRLTAALTALILILGVVLGGAAFRVTQQRQVRQSRLDQVLSEAQVLRARAIAHSDDPASWQALVEALRRADDLVRDEVGDGEARKRLLAMGAEAGAGHRMASDDRALIQKLGEIRANRQDAGSDATHAAYDNAFRDAGFDFNTLIPAEAAQSLERRPASLRTEIATYLDDWYGLDILGDGLHQNPIQEREERLNNRAIERSGAVKLRELACLIDRDEYRGQLRSLRALGPLKDRLGKLKELAADPNAGSLPASTAVLLSTYFEAAGDLDSAAKVLKQAVLKHPEDLWVNYRLAANLQFSTPYPHEEAVRYYMVARAIRPTTAHMLAHLLSDLPGEMPNAKAIYLDLAARQPELPSHLVCLARALELRGRTREAAEIADRLIPKLQAEVRKSSSPGRLQELSRLQAIKGDVPGALASLHELGKSLPNNNHWIYHEAGNLLRASAHDLEGAVTEYTKAIKEHPSFDGSHVELGRTLIELGRYEEALVHIREADRLRPGDWALQVNMGTALMALKRTDQAMAAYREAMRLEPGRSFIHVQLGRDLLKQGKLDQAIAAFHEANRVNPRDTNSHNALAQLAISKGDFNAAAAEFREVMRINPSEPDAQGNLGLMLYKSGKIDEALAACREAARLNPDWGNTRYKYGAILYNTGRDYETALVELQAATRLRPDFESYLTLARVLMKLKKDREAIAALRSAIGFAAKSPENAKTLTRWIADLERGLDPDTYLPR